ncbi:AraC family transcriptional regulator [Algoriphagus algorifonticola]|uniref:AraC family transcriptional regulator n=1 Tax=Algoriphagus algorifonticola TaxID=2593007 RepID=UPI00119E5361|nr:AraC family transcriptional regulator [Algoriphagus algorifonticola]
MSKVISFQIPKSQKEFIRFQQDRGNHFYDKLHQHPQLQLTLILEGKGQFLSGDFVGRFEPGDIFFLGENVPHVFRSDPEYFEADSNLKSAGNTLFFDFQALGDSILEVEDLQGLRSLSQTRGACFHVSGACRERLTVLIAEFESCRGLFRFQKGMEILAVLEQEKDDLKPLNHAELNWGLSEKDGSRMDLILRFLLENKNRTIRLEEAASVASMSKEAFCRFFKLRTRKTFTQYLNQLRVNEALKLLEETELGIAEIAFQVGFENLSYFNRAFRKIQGETPSYYRRKRN